jgi:hypothetical protein
MWNAPRSKKQEKAEETARHKAQKAFKEAKADREKPKPSTDGTCCIVIDPSRI